MKKLFSVLLAVAMFATMFVGCQKAGSAGNAIQIGGIGPLTGTTAVYGIATKQGAEVAVEEINALGGLQFSLNFQDDEGDAEKGVNAYNKLKDWGMDLLYGCTTTGSCVAVAGKSYADLGL